MAKGEFARGAAAQVSSGGAHLRTARGATLETEAAHRSDLGYSVGFVGQHSSL